MKNCIRFLSVLMALLLACAAGSAELSAPGVLPLSNETIHFTVGVAKSSVVEDWNTNAMTLKLQKDLNVELEFVEYPSDSKELIQKVELQIMAGGDELPDIIMHGLGGLANLVKYGQMCMILPTTEYYRNQATSWMKRWLRKTLPRKICCDSSPAMTGKSTGCLNIIRP